MSHLSSRFIGTGKVWRVGTYEDVSSADFSSLLGSSASFVRFFDTLGFGSATGFDAAALGSLGLFLDERRGSVVSAICFIDFRGSLVYSESADD